VLDCAMLRRMFRAAVAACVCVAIPSASIAAGGASPVVVPLGFIKGIPFVKVVVGSTASELMFDSGGQLGLTLPRGVIEHAGTVKMLGHRSKHGDAAGNVYEVEDILAADVSVGGVRLPPVKGTEHFHWGLESSSGDAGLPDELNNAREKGMIGVDAFAGRPLLFDYARRELTIYEAGDMPDVKAPGWQSLVLEYGRQGPQVILVFGGKRTRLVLDTGAMASILTPDALDAAAFPDLCKNMPEGGNYCGRMDFPDVHGEDGGRIGALAVELVRMTGVPFDGLLGADFFASHLVFIDIANHRVWLKANP
jgi:hypothetical protein